MGWEYRSGRLYYYRKSRQSKKVSSEYIGAGEIVELIHAMDVLDRQQHDRVRQEWKAQISEIQAVDLEIEKLNELLRNLVLATLLTSGYHPHKGQWRRSRHD